jgi:uncharacterized protein
MSVINWFEIPVTDMDRATRFYSTVLGEKVELAREYDMPMAFLPMSSQEDVGGALVSGDGYIPSQQGTTVYLNGGEDLGPMLDRVAETGGQVLLPKTSIGEHGFIGIFVDTEGNKVGLHSMA